MGIEDGIIVPVSADCGHEFEIPLAGLTPETDLVCPVCGVIDHFTDDQLVRIRDQAKVARAAALKEARKSVSDGLAKAARGLKHIKYRPKR